MKATALITDMNQPLGNAVGNAVEVMEVINYLKGIKRDPRLHEVVLSLAVEMLQVAGLSDSKEHAIQKITDVLDNGQAAETFQKMVSELGGPKNILDETLTTANVVKPVPAPHSGTITHIETREVGLAVVELGGGRKKASDTIDHTVGFTDVLGLGEKVDKGQPLAIVHAKNEDDANHIIALIQKAYRINDSNVEPSPTIIERLT